ncbi:PREDICTED: glutathione S-transferase T3-like [Brassica oleracea var. oleracea]|uniref:Myb-like domain-containing protein n=1 Tax=Brassica oleracea var. oleracea TaxID=109376 RepID=A0A0D3BCD2_BRAOL|nr:PREDICTED: glutathione S-transferase T3-like [Brassica oleracea var. oleracea]
MDSNPYMNLNFVDLLQSQQDTSVGVESPSIPSLSTQATEGRNFEHKTPSERKERRTWSPTDDVVLISSWLNTSKDPLVGNEQRSVAFWKRVAAYFEASPKVGGCEKRESSHCKQRWQKINDLVSKFAGAYEAATREKRSGQNENDVLKLAHEIFFTNHNKKFTLEHAWKELRNDQKWCTLYTAKNDGSSKKRKCDEGSQSASSVSSAIDDEGSNRPQGVKSAKASGKKPMGEGKDLSQFQTIWSIKMQDSFMKERLSKMKLLDSLIAKQDPLQDYEEALKKKLITELMTD